MFGLRQWIEEGFYPEGWVGPQDGLGLAPFKRRTTGGQRVRERAVHASCKRSMLLGTTATLCCWVLDDASYSQPMNLDLHDHDDYVKHTDILETNADPAGAGCE